MKELWSKRWKKLRIWVCGYLSIVAYAIVGGYTIVKCDDRELKETSKRAFVVVLIFTALEALSLLFSAINSVGGGMSGFLSVYHLIVVIGKIVVFACFAILSFFEGKDESKAEKRSEKALPTEKTAGGASAEEDGAQADRNDAPEQTE